MMQRMEGDRVERQSHGTLIRAVRPHHQTSGTMGLYFVVTWFPRRRRGKM
jgi:hypothetical protein